ncbi:hypothetical protein H1P_850015 [Hyella patelloides LEGE 07179]|uniref:Uncharacterized protein n=1 Tax=Hyella patelloides LEGE 07179 TaxID=945734 RepID=A0A563W4Q1_9CYAN|nr:hypothetical protein [Hyella patelloides]VEP18658.1 hypothetical protein H1P_850015 [Hyella patelloides LEGE 07179]
MKQTNGAVAEYRPTEPPFSLAEEHEERDEQGKDDEYFTGYTIGRNFGQFGADITDKENPLWQGFKAGFEEAKGKKAIRAYRKRKALTDEVGKLFEKTLEGYEEKARTERNFLAVLMISVLFLTLAEIISNVLAY